VPDVAIRVEGLGKQYRLGARTQPYGTLRDSLAGFAGAPLRAARRLAGRASEAGTRGHRPDFWALQDVSFEVRRLSTASVNTCAADQAGSIELSVHPLSLQVVTIIRSEPHEIRRRRVSLDRQVASAGRRGI
jgi:hypothetical protein